MFYIPEVEFLNRYEGSIYEQRLKEDRLYIYFYFLFVYLRVRFVKNVTVSEEQTLPTRLHKSPDSSGTPVGCNHQRLFNAKG